ncbi:hypothetical protein [Streptococcus oricebi]|uniref:Cingulin n=1 Tax=Streptococcus oricebi TaxID=1547447 RepID=A0ABS5B6G4_9STRE|nr:hypothetical protein [Streptococcus oricebi]MBP2623554.1 hypothetical protein [Streptococcus oricebi]
MDKPKTKLASLEKEINQLEEAIEETYQAQIDLDKREEGTLSQFAQGFSYLQKMELEVRPPKEEMKQLEILADFRVLEGQIAQDFQDSREELKKQRYDLEDQLDSLHYKRRRLYQQEEEEKNG